MTCVSEHRLIAPFEFNQERKEIYFTAHCLDCDSTICENMDNYKPSDYNVQLERFGHIGSYRVWEKVGDRE